jgi:Skp family chaperone for outer membrane proteins
VSHKFLRFALAGPLLAAAWWLGRASGDEVPAEKPWPPTSIAIVDVTRIFKDSPRLARLRDELKLDFATESVGVKALAEELKQFQERAKAAQGDRQELNSLKGEFEKKAAEAKAAAAKLQKEFVSREVEVYRSFYADVESEVKDYAEAHGIRLVIRTQETEEPTGEAKEADVADPKNAKAVLDRLNRLVVYQDSLDITDAVIRQMKDGGSY